MTANFSDHGQTGNFDSKVQSAKIEVHTICKKIIRIVQLTFKKENIKIIW